MLGSLVDQIILLVTEKCRPANEDWKQELSQALVDLFQQPFRDNEVLTAEQLNILEARISLMEKKFNALDRVRSHTDQKPPYLIR